MRSKFGLFFLGVVFLAAFAFVAPSIEKASVLYVGPIVLALSLLAAHFTKVGKFGALLPMALGALFLHGVEGSGNAWVIMTIIVGLCVLLSRPRVVLSKSVDNFEGEFSERHPSRSLDMAAFQEDAGPKFPWSKPRTA